MIDFRSDYEIMIEERNKRICKMWQELSAQNPGVKNFRLAAAIGRKVGLVPLSVMNIVRKNGLAPAPGTV